MDNERRATYDAFIAALPRLLVEAGDVRMDGLTAVFNEAVKRFGPVSAAAGNRMMNSFLTLCSLPSRPVHTDGEADE